MARSLIPRPLLPGLGEGELVGGEAVFLVQFAGLDGFDAAFEGGGDEEGPREPFIAGEIEGEGLVRSQRPARKGPEVRVVRAPSKPDRLRLHEFRRFPYRRGRNKPRVGSDTHPRRRVFGSPRGTWSGHGIRLRASRVVRRTRS